MWDPINEIKKNATDVGVDVQPMPLGDSVALISKAEKLHVLEKSHASSRRLFEKLNNCSSCNLELGIKLLKSFPITGEVYAFFESKKDLVFCFRSLSNCLDVYVNCAVFTLYITNESCSFLLALTEEQTLVCNASAADWLDGVI
jgi:hypothetical protein